MRPSRYTLVAIILHWVMALGILALAVIGLAITHLKLDPLKLFQLYQLHKSIGITILLAAIFRLAWRLANRPPTLPFSMTQFARKAAEGSHFLLYFFFIALPLTGWALVSASMLNIPTVLYGVVPWPHLPILSTLDNKKPVEDALKLVHAYGAWALIALATAHAGAALHHHFIAKDDVLRRMLPGGRNPPTPLKSESLSP
jgi:cytochrome b561